MKIRRGDTVVVTTGDDASATPRRVIQVLESGRKLMIEGVNRVHKHVRRGHPRSPQGGRLHLEMPIDSSNVMLYCNSCNQGVRVGLRYAKDGSKERFCRKCSAAMGSVSGPRTAYAAK